MITVESANNGRNGVLGFVGAIIFGGAAACFAIFMGGTLGIILAAVCGTIGAVSGIAGLAVNWSQSKKERDAALAYHQSRTAEHTANTMDKGVNVVLVNKEEPQIKEENAKNTSTTTQSNNDISKTAKVISKIIKPDGTTSVIEGPVHDEASKNLTLVRQVIKTIKK